MRLPGIVACNKLDLGRLNLYGDRIHPTDVVEWLEHEAPPENEWSEPRQLILNEDGIVGGIGGLLTTLKAAFSTSSVPKPYVVRILGGWDHGMVNEALANEKSHEVLSIRIAQKDVIVECA
ncbi:hypothetical protein AAVH_27962 [Aphelenchoides avenae]|nr:hypothetical protein AAVH_27962 [Aphelenchus avenae]